MTLPEARLLRYFLAVAEERNFTRAAARLHIAQPALSAQIRRLESLLGVELLHRTTRSVRLTEAGRAVWERGAPALAALEEVWESARRVGRGESGRLRLAHSISAGYGTVPELVAAVGRSLPEVRITAEPTPTPDIAHAVLEGRADVGVARSPERVPGLSLPVLRRERRGILVAAGHPLAGRTGVTPAEVAAYPVALHAREANPGRHDEVLELFRRAGVRPELRAREMAFDPGRRVPADASTVSLVEESTVAELPGRLRWVPLTGTGLAPATTRLVLPAGGGSPVARRFATAALTVARAAGWLDTPPE
ncbi:LysR substrate-binding domain-containing protein (plasmid) [Streptomyces sp. BI20]|uniref:LysR substrate-binding domain-containing protein n=1 Tax=Streptomyces sp. BI20 TaxID=3403460 RepID=UPI003C73EA09